MYFFVIAGISWFVAQTTKVLMESIISKRFVLERYLGDGGYPSCHSAFVTGGFVASLIKYNWGDILSTDISSMTIAIFAIVWVITIRDAMGTRLQQGQTAKHVNEITKYFQENVDETFFKIFPILKAQGHLPHEVIAGVITGTITAISTILIIDRGNPIMAIISGTTSLAIVISIGLIINNRARKVKVNPLTLD